MRSLIPAALALLAACAGPSQPAGGDPPPVQDPPSAAQPAQPGPAQPAPTPSQGGQVTVELVAGEGGSSTGAEQGATAQGAAGGAVVRGTMSTPTPCHRLAGAVQRAGETVTLTVSAAADPDAMCIQSIGSIPYTATVRGLPAGSYTLRVVHTYPGTGWETATALETRITAG